MATITIVLLVVVIFFRKKVKISIGIIREASNYVRKIPLLIIFPMVPFAMLFWTFFVARFAVCLARDTEPSFNLT